MVLISKVIEYSADIVPFRQQKLKECKTIFHCLSILLICNEHQKQSVEDVIKMGV